MKLKITDVMICEWDAVTKCMIVSPAEGWKVNVNYPISEAHASIVTMEKMDGVDYVGKWVKCTYKNLNKWTKIICQSNNPLCFVCKDIEGARAISSITYESGGIMISKEFLDLTDPRDYNPDEKPEPKPHNALTPSELEEGKSYLLCKQTAYNKNADKIATEGYYYEASPTFRFFASELTKGIDHGTDHEFISKYFEKYVHQPKPERKPHQLKEYDAVECTPEERAEIIRIADECGVPVYIGTRDPESIEDFPNLHFTGREFTGLVRKDQCVKTCWKWHTVHDFIAKIRGTHTENKVNVTEHKHESV